MSCEASPQFLGHNFGGIGRYAPRDMRNVAKFAANQAGISGAYHRRAVE